MYRAALDTMEHRLARRKPVGAVRHWRRMPDAIAPNYSVCDFAASKEVDTRYRTIVRPTASIELGLNSPFNRSIAFARRSG